MLSLSEPQVEVPQALLAAERIEMNLRRAVIGVVGGVFNAAAVALAMLDSPYPHAAVAWFAAIVLAGLVRLRLYARRKRDGWRSIDPVADARRIAAMALFNGLVWGVGIAAGAVIANERQFTIVALLSGGMLGAAILTYASMARAAILFMTPICIGTIVAWSVFPGANTGLGAFFCSMYLFILGRGVVESEEAFEKAILQREELRDAGSTVQLLLNDFEQQASDWLWRIDGNGLVETPSERFAQAAERAWQLLQGVPFLSLFDEGPEREQLAEHLAHKVGFRDLTLPLTIENSPHWWTLSAQPDGLAMRGVARDVTAQKRAEERVSHMAHYDGLTELANRLLFFDGLKRLLHRQRKGDCQVAVLCLDLDDFKGVNDTWGHPVGDRLLCEVARRLEDVMRGDDLIARLGGDEFAIVMCSPDARQIATGIAQRVVEAVHRPFQFENLQILTSASVGFAVAEKGDRDVEALMRKADLALYSAKKNGRCCYAEFEAGMDEEASRRRALEADLRKALAQGEFELWYQPIVDVRSGQTASFEALVRWNHPEHGLILPETFIPLAEDSGLIVPLGEWIIRQACSELAAWPRHLSVAVNLSPAQMRSPNLLSAVVQAIADNGIDAGRLELEITESVLMQDNQVTASLLHRLRALGVRIALDDFGTGFSSLNYLRAFPFDKIKIDRSFIAGLGENDDTLPIVRAVIALARGMGMRTTAEGVENTCQLAVLREEGCDQVQGYLFSPAARADALPELRPLRAVAFG